MTIDLELDGSRRQVVLRRDSDHWKVEIDGRELVVSVVETGGPGRRLPGDDARWSMLIGPVRPPDGGRHDSRSVASTVSRKSYAIAVEPSAGGELLVHVNGVVVVPVTVVDRRRRGHSGGGDRDVQGEPRTIVAPMPGRIVKVLVQPGEPVQARQGLVVVEAMKMENELRAPRAGMVAEVRVTEGSSVEANAVLVVLT